MNENFKKLLEKFNNNPYSLSRDEVYKLQENLGFVENGRDNNKLDGWMGNDTIKAVQRLVGAKDDGIWGKNSKSITSSFIKNIQVPNPLKGLRIPSWDAPIRDAMDPVKSEARRDAEAAVKTTIALNKPLDKDKISALLNYDNNNKLREILQLPLISEQDRNNPYKLLDDEFVKTAHSKLGNDYALVSRSMTNDLLDKIYSHDWGFELKETPWYKSHHPATEHYQWSQGNTSSRYFGPKFSQQEKEREFVEYNPEYKELYNNYLNEKNDANFQEAKHKAGFDNVLTENEYNWYNTIFQKASTGMYNQNRDKYTDYSIAGNNPFLGDHAYPIVEAKNENRVATANSKYGEIYPDRTFVKTPDEPGLYADGNGEKYNYRIALSYAATGAKPEGDITISRIQPMGQNPTPTKAQKRYLNKNNLEQLALTSPQIWKSTNLSSAYKDMTNPGVSNMVNDVTERANNFKEEYPIIDKVWPEMIDKIKSTGGGNIPQYLERFKELGYKNGKLAKTPENKKVSAYDLNGLGNYTIYLNDDGSAKSVYDEYDWTLKGLHAGIMGSAPVYAPSPDYEKERLKNYNEFYNNYSKSKEKGLEDLKTLMGQTLKHVKPNGS